MIFPSSDISKSLEKFGLDRTDTIMIHGDAGVAAQYKWDASTDKVSEFLRSVVAYFDKGTVIVPTFTYSATKGEVFAPSQTPSDVGLFSEKFRLLKGIVRSQHPIFSVGCIGAKANFFSESSTVDCFGPQTFFDKFYHNNGKILALGCSLERVTFVHYVEQMAEVPYRYIKYFDSLTQDPQSLKKRRVSYFVRDLDLDTSLDLKRLEDAAINKKKMIKSSFGRFPARLITATDFYDIAYSLLKEDPYALIKERFK